MHKNLLDKMMRSNEVNRGHYCYVYGGSGKFIDIVPLGGGKQYTRNEALDEMVGVAVITDARGLPITRIKSKTGGLLTENEKKDIESKLKNSDSAAYQARSGDEVNKAMSKAIRRITKRWRWF